jgi:hypothetical protein
MIGVLLAISANGAEAIQLQGSSPLVFLCGERVGSNSPPKNPNLHILLPDVIPNTSFTIGYLAAASGRPFVLFEL